MAYYNRFISQLSSMDADVAKFIKACQDAGVTLDNTQNQYLQFIVGSFKGINKSYNASGLDIWSKSLVIRPYVGAAANSHALNLKNAAQKIITWHGTITHNSGGAQGDGSTGYGDSGYIVSDIMSVGNGGCSAYITTNVQSSTARDFGSTYGAAELWINSRNGASTARLIGFNDGFNFTLPSADSRGLITVQSTALNVIAGFKNGANKTSSTTINRGVPPIQNMFELACNVNGAANFFSGRQTAFKVDHQTLTDTEVAVMYAIIQQAQTMLGRQV